MYWFNLRLTVNFHAVDIGAISVSGRDPSNANAEEICAFTLECSTVISPHPLPANVSYPSFEWFFGPTNTSLPPGVTVFDVRNSGNQYISTLKFSPLLSHHFGMYTCQLGGNERLAASTTIYGKYNTATISNEQ